MPTLGAVAVVVQEGRVLLILRDDLAIWGLPGGRVEHEESLAEAAIREVGEETGLVVALDRLIGVYSRPLWFGGDHQVVFLAHPTGEKSPTNWQETRDVQFFDPADLPEMMLWWHRPIIADAISGVGGSGATTVQTHWPTAISRADFYALRDRGAIPLEDIASLLIHPGPDAVSRDIEPD